MDAVICGSGGATSLPTPAQCTGTNFVPDQPYDPATGTAHFAASSVIIDGLFPLAWLPVDFALTAVPEPGLSVLMGVALLARRAGTTRTPARPGSTA